MANFIDEFMKSYGPEVTRHMSSNFGVDQGTVQKLIPQLAPLILGGLKRQKDEQGGDVPALAPVVLGALSRKRDAGGAGISGIGSLLDADGDGSIIEDVAGFLLKGSGTQTKGKGILGSLLGGLFRKQ
jgi:hypothetical protein